MTYVSQISNKINTWLSQCT